VSSTVDRNGMMGFMLYIYARPTVERRTVLWAAATSALSMVRAFRHSSRAVLLACGTLTLVRTNGITGDARSDLRWRWTPTAEERLLPVRPFELTAPAPSSNPAIEAPAEKPAEKRLPVKEPVTAAWPGFAVLDVTAWFMACASKQIGLAHRRLNCGGDRSGPGGLRLLWPVIVSLRRSSAVKDEIVCGYSLKTGEPYGASRPSAILGVERGAGPRGHTDARRWDASIPSARPES
jgi:hypothetical protein